MPRKWTPRLQLQNLLLRVWPCAFGLKTCNSANYNQFQIYDHKQVSLCWEVAFLIILSRTPRAHLSIGFSNDGALTAVSLSVVGH
jgi:hypothetical protein